jgi:hypothetical protein
LSKLKERSNSRFTIIKTTKKQKQANGLAKPKHNLRLLFPSAAKLYGLMAVIHIR